MAESTWYLGIVPDPQKGKDIAIEVRKATGQLSTAAAKKHGINRVEEWFAVRGARLKDVAAKLEAGDIVDRFTPDNPPTAKAKAATPEPKPVDPDAEAAAAYAAIEDVAAEAAAEPPEPEPKPARRRRTRAEAEMAVAAGHAKSDRKPAKRART